MSIRFETEIAGGDSFHVADITERHCPSLSLAHRTGPSPVTVADSPNAGIGGGGVSRMMQTTVSPSEGLLIMHPEILVTPSRVSEAVGCIRRGVLSDRVRSYGCPSLPATMGSLKHSFIEVHGSMDKDDHDLFCV